MKLIKILMILMIFSVSSCGFINVEPKYKSPVCPTVPKCPQWEKVKQYKECVPKSVLDKAVLCSARQKQALDACIKLYEKGWKHLN